jgi:hypothetical protein
VGTILVGYDLNASGKDYEGLIARLKEYPLWWHHLDSTWLLKTDDSASVVRDALKQFLDDDDELLVVDVSGDARAWVGFSERARKWLKDTW